MRIEKLTTLAFSMYSNKGAYALLLGSGISSSAHIPTGWKVEEKLIQRLGASQGVTESDDWHQWYKDKYQYPASYSSLLKEIVGTPTERVQLMKPFFEPDDKEKELGWKTPTKAHIAIARLAKRGYVRVVLTTNFDRLLEKAFESEGVTPQVISHDGAIAQATPIVHSKIPTIIKINGDYIDCKFRNTTEELDEYSPEMKSYLHRIFEDFGLITCGWSGEWDKGLVDIINGASQSRYNSFFACVGEANDSLIALSFRRSGELMPIEDADNLFTELYEQVLALEKYDANANMTREMMMARVKRYLSSEQYNIEFADIIEKYGANASSQIIDVAKYNFTLNKDVFERYLEIHLRAVAPLLDAAILTARWGKECHIKLFGEILKKLCIKSIVDNEIAETQCLHALAPMLLLNTIGVACVKFHRFKELDDILKLTVPADNFMGNNREHILSMLGITHWKKEVWDTMLEENFLYPLSGFLRKQLVSIFEDTFVVRSEFISAFDIWEHLKALVYAYNRSDSYCLAPSGEFLIRKCRYELIENEPYTLFFKEADRLQDDWEPIKQGMFGGSYNNYKQVYEQTILWYKQHGML